MDYRKNQCPRRLAAGRWLAILCATTVFSHAAIVLAKSDVDAQKIIRAALDRLDSLRTYSAKVSSVVVLYGEKKSLFKKKKEKKDVPTHMVGTLIVDRSTYPAKYRMEEEIMQFGFGIRKLTVCDGKKVTVKYGQGDRAVYQFYDIKKAGVFSKKKQRGGSENSAGRVLRAILRNFTLTRLANQRMPDGDPVYVIEGKLLRHPPDGTYAGLPFPRRPERITLRISQRTRFIRRLEAYNVKGLGFFRKKESKPFAIIQYDDIQLNIPIKPSTFELRIPIGAYAQDITDQVRQEIQKSRK